jgi:hypothetical protein
VPDELQGMKIVAMARALQASPIPPARSRSGGSGTNPAVSLPELSRVRAVLAQERLFLVVQDIFMTATAQLAPARHKRHPVALQRRASRGHRATVRRRTVLE